MNKKFTLIVLAITVASSSLFAQSKGLFFTLNGGYSWSGMQKTAQELTFQPGTPPTDPATSSIVSMMNQNLSDTSGNRYKGYAYDGYGRGGVLNFSIGYMINPYVGVEMGLSYLMGATLKSVSTDNGSLGTNTTFKTATSSYGLSLMPSIRFRAAKPEAKFYPYGRFGISLPVFGATQHTLNVDAPNFFAGSATSEIKVKTHSTISIGVNGSLGVGYDVLDWFGVFAEVNANLLHVRPSESTLEKYTLNVVGQPEADVLSTLTNFSKDVVYKDKITEADNTTFFGKTRGATGTNHVDETQARTELRQSANFSSIGVSLGVKFFINKDKLCKKKK